MEDYATALAVGMGIYLAAEAFYTSIMLGKPYRHWSEIKPYGPSSYLARTIRRQARIEFWERKPI